MAKLFISDANKYGGLNDRRDRYTVKIITGFITLVCKCFHVSLPAYYTVQ